jgi:DNA ligase (NAD+)
VPPTVCPYCGEPLKENGANLFCPNKNCEPRIAAALAHFASKNAMDIDGFSENTAILPIPKKGVKSYADLYELTAADLADLDGFKDKKIQNLLGAIEKSKTPTLAAFIYAIGVGGIGKVGAKDLAKKFGTLERVQAATREELVEMENVGEITADSILAFFASEENLAELAKLQALGVQIKEDMPVQAGGVFAGEKVVLTGTLSGFKRSEAQKIIESLGGECLGSVTAKTTLVLAGEEAGSKLDKAKKLGIKIIGEEEFLAMIEK